MTDAGLAGLLRAPADPVRDVPDWPQPGVVFKDITPLLADADGFAAVVDALVDGWAPRPARGQGRRDRGPRVHPGRAGRLRLRCRLRAGAQEGQAARVRRARRYALEYGEADLEVGTDAFAPGDRVLVVDDVLATGGTAAATIELIHRAGAEVVGMSVLMELAFLGGRVRLGGVPLHALPTV